MITDLISSVRGPIGCHSVRSAQCTFDENTMLSCLIGRFGDPTEVCPEECEKFIQEATGTTSQNIHDWVLKHHILYTVLESMNVDILNKKILDSIKELSPGFIPNSTDSLMREIYFHSRQELSPQDKERILERASGHYGYRYDENYDPVSAAYEDFIDTRINSCIVAHVVDIFNQCIERGWFTRHHVAQSLGVFQKDNRRKEYLPPNLPVIPKGASGKFIQAVNSQLKGLNRDTTIISYGCGNGSSDLEMLRYLEDQNSEININLVGIDPHTDPDDNLYALHAGCVFSNKTALPNHNLIDAATSLLAAEGKQLGESTIVLNRLSWHHANTSLGRMMYLSRSADRLTWLEETTDDNCNQNLCIRSAGIAWDVIANTAYSDNWAKKYLDDPDLFSVRYPNLEMIEREYGYFSCDVISNRTITPGAILTFEPSSLMATSQNPSRMTHETSKTSDFSGGR